MGSPIDYTSPFWIEAPVGNNALSFDRRGSAPRLWVPSLIDGSVIDVGRGSHVVFEDFDEHGQLQPCMGLAHLVRMAWAGVPTVVMDNHNHAFYFWCDAIERGRLQPGATLIHIDQHRDTRIPERMYDGATLADAFDYTNFHLNVGNYIVPAERAGMIDEIQFVTGASALEDHAWCARTNKILNIDLDFFAPEMADVDFAKARRFIHAHLPSASLVTIATSPFFIDQTRALAVLHALL